MYEVMVYHSEDDKETLGEGRPYQKCGTYSEAVHLIKQIAAGWASLNRGTVVAKRNRIEFRGNDYGVAFYIKKEI